MEDEYLFDLEIKWQNGQKNRDFGKEILETVTYEETKYFLSPLMEIRIGKKKELERLYKSIVRLVKKRYAPETFEFDFNVGALWSLKGAKEDIKNQNELDSLERYYCWNEARKSVNAPSRTSISRRDSESLKEAVKQVRIESLCRMPLKPSGGNRFLGKCPFHEEKTASFTIYRDSNTFYCFGCHEHGDSIAFYQRLYGVSFWDAVKQLTGTV